MAPSCIPARLVRGHSHSEWTACLVPSGSASLLAVALANISDRHLLHFSPWRAGRGVAHRCCPSRLTPAVHSRPDRVARNQALTPLLGGRARCACPCTGHVAACMCACAACTPHAVYCGTVARGHGILPEGAWHGPGSTLVHIRNTCSQHEPAGAAAVGSTGQQQRAPQRQGMT